MIIFKNKYVLIVLFVLFLGLVVAGSATAADRHTTVVNSTSKTDNSKVQLAKTNIPFIENQGQYPAEVKYYANTFYGTAFVTSDSIVHSISNKKGTKKLVIKEQFLSPGGKVISFTPVGVDKSPTKVSYFTGSKKMWKTGLKTYNTVSLGTIYPGVKVDLKTHGSNVEKIFTIKPGVQPRDIKVQVLGADGLKLDGKGNLQLLSSFGNIKMTKPTSYQKINKRTVNIKAKYSIQGNTYTYKVGKYNTKEKLTIDPHISYCEYIGGTGDDIVSGIAVDSVGCAYITGETSSTQSDGFPVKVGPDKTHNGGYDAFVAKINSTGTELIYCGYIGGARDDRGYGIAVDTWGNAYITGKTESSNLPVKGGTDTTYNSREDAKEDAFIAKINSTGTELIYCGYIGGALDDYGSGIAVDSSGNAYITGRTYSDEEDFPVKIGPGPYYNKNLSTTAYGYGSDAFVAKVNTTGTIVYCGFIGTQQNDYGVGIAVDTIGSAYITGYTNSDYRDHYTLPDTGHDITTPNGMDSAFIVKIDPSGTEFSYCVCIGGNASTFVKGIAVDSSGNAYITGRTASSELDEFPVKVGPDLTYNGTRRDLDSDAFVAKINQTGNLVYCGYIGGSHFDMGNGIAVDSSGNAYITGETKSTESEGFPVLGGLDTTYNDDDWFIQEDMRQGDAFVAKINPGGTGLLYCGYIGGEYADWGNSIVVDNIGKIYITGYTGSTGSAFVAKIDESPQVGVNIPGGSYNTNKTITLTMNEKGNIYYTLNGTTPTTNSTKYTTPIIITKSTILKVMAVDSLGNKSPVYTQTYKIDKTSPTVTVNPKGGLYNTNKKIVLKINETGKIYYTINGSIPTTKNTKYTTSILITSNKTLKYFAVDQVGNKSPICSQKYTIDKIAPKVNSTVPINNKSGYSRTASIYIKFTEKIVVSINWSKITVKNISTNKYITTSKSLSNNTLTLKTGVRTKNTWYTVTIPARAVRDAAGNKLAATYSFRFRTGA